MKKALLIVVSGFFAILCTAQLTVQADISSVLEEPVLLQSQNSTQQACSEKDPSYLLGQWHIALWQGASEIDPTGIIPQDDGSFQERHYKIIRSFISGENEGKKYKDFRRRGGDFNLSTEQYSAGVWSKVPKFPDIDFTANARNYSKQLGVNNAAYWTVTNDANREKLKNMITRRMSGVLIGEQCNSLYNTRGILPVPEKPNNETFKLSPDDYKAGVLSVAPSFPNG